MSLPAGFYDVLLTQLLAQQIDGRADRRGLDEGDAHHSLTQRFATVLALHLRPVRPLSIVWELEHAMPPSFFSQARVAAG